MSKASWIEIAWIVLGILLIVGGDRLGVSALLHAGLALIGLGLIVGGGKAIVTRRYVLRRRGFSDATYYGLGAVLFRCLSGRPPYAGSTTQILHAHVYEPLTIPDEVVQRGPTQVIDVISKSMAKSPSERYGSALEMAQDLAAVASAELAPSRAAVTGSEDETADPPLRGGDLVAV